MICTTCRCEMEYHERFATQDDKVPYDRYWICENCGEQVDECDPKFKMPYVKQEEEK